MKDRDLPLPTRDSSQTVKNSCGWPSHRKCTSPYSLEYRLSTSRTAAHIAIPLYNLYLVLEVPRILDRDGRDTFDLHLVPNIVKPTCQRDNKDELGDHGGHM